MNTEFENFLGYRFVSGAQLSSIQEKKTSGWKSFATVSFSLPSWVFVRLVKVVVSNFQVLSALLSLFAFDLRNVICVIFFCVFFVLLEFIEFIQAD
jgi:uncharacterized membrane-anchored protein